MTSPLQQKLKINGPVVVTANRLDDGAVVYRTRDGRWAKRLDQAAVVTTAPAASELLAAGVADDTGAVGAYIAPVQLDRDGTTRPGNLREVIRHAGPTINLPVAFGILSQRNPSQRNLSQRNPSDVHLRRLRSHAG